MTTAVVTIALILSFFPGVIVIILEKVYPALHTRFAWKLSDSLLFLNSLVNPLIYCYRDHRFRNAVLQMLRIRKPTTVSATVAVKFVKQKNSLDPGNVSLQKKEENPVRLARSASCDCKLDNDLGILRATFAHLCFCVFTLISWQLSQSDFLE